jgi:hypothetical protein
VTGRPPVVVPIRQTPRHLPLTRGQCAGGERPCPYVSCRHHLYLDVTPKEGRLQINFAGEPDAMKESCSLDVAERGEHTLEEVAALIGLSRQGTIKIETKVLRKLARNAAARELEK